MIYDPFTTTSNKCDTSSISTQLDEISTQISNLEIPSSSGTNISFMPLSINPTYQENSSHGWNTAPTNLSAIFDSDPNTATGWSEIAGFAWRWGEVLITPQILIPQYTKINFKVGLRSMTNNQRPAFNLDVFNSYENNWVTIWSLFGKEMSDTIEVIYLINSMIPFVWSALSFRSWDVGSYGARMRIYYLNVYSVSCS